jgi:hypothetical protein
LTLSDELVLSTDDRLKEPQVLGVSAVNFNAVNEMLDDFLVDFIAKRQIVFENCTNCLGVEIARVEEQVKLLVKKHLIVLVAKTEVLEELMSQLHQLVHSRVILLVIGNLQQVENNRVNTDVPQQPLLVLPWLDNSSRAWLNAQLVHADENVLDFCVFLSLFREQWWTFPVIDASRLWNLSKEIEFHTPFHFHQSQLTWSSSAKLLLL